MGSNSVRLDRAGLIWSGWLAETGQSLLLNFALSEPLPPPPHDDDPFFFSRSDVLLHAPCLVLWFDATQPQEALTDNPV